MRAEADYCSIDHSKPNDSRVKFILMGAPGAGKGTLAANLRTSKREHISSGELFRQEINGGTPLGVKIQDTIKRGELVRDDLTISLMRKWFWGRRPSQGFILDGFPRTLMQARCFDEWMDARNEVLTGCLLLELSEQATIDRLSRRRICPVDGSVFHLEYKPPRTDGKCDACGGDLVQREDDHEDVVRRRYLLYQQWAHPLAEHYRNQGLLFEFSADVAPKALSEKVLHTFGLTPVPE